MSAITELAHMILDEKELALTEHLSVILGDDKYNSLLAMRAILPVYWKQEGNLSSRSLLAHLFESQARNHVAGGK